MSWACCKQVEIHCLLAFMHLDVQQWILSTSAVTLSATLVSQLLHPMIDVTNTWSPVSFISLMVQKKHKVLAMMWHNLWCSCVVFKPDTKVTDVQLDVVRICNVLVVRSRLPSAEVALPSRWRRDATCFKPICLMRCKESSRLPKGVLH